MFSYRVHESGFKVSDWHHSVGQWFGIDQVKKQVDIVKKWQKLKDVEFCIKYLGKYIDLEENQIKYSFKIKSDDNS